MCVSVDSLIEVLLFNLQEFALKKTLLLRDVKTVPAFITKVFVDCTGNRESCKQCGITIDKYVRVQGESY